VQTGQTPQSLNKDVPDLMFSKIRAFFALFLDLVFQITFISKFHDNVECVSRFIKEGFLVRNDVGVAKK
jgi:hypothetical protein